MPATIADERSLPSVIEALLKPECYPHPVTRVELKQTHISYVMLAGEFAYKVRKTVRFAFIDSSTLARRLALCQREVELNRRLSPDVYLAVIAIRQAGNGIILEQGTDNIADAIEFAVKMRRLPEDRRLDLIIRRGAATAHDIKAIAHTISVFHANTSNTHSWAYGAAATIWRMTIGNLVEMEQLRPEEPLTVRIAEIEVYSRRYIASHWELLNQRARDGQVREGHGDLRTDAIYLTSNSIRIIDCLEFDERLRYGDIANEVAFLAMDIARLGRPDLSNQLVAHFVSDPDVAVLIPFYKCYRATVRAKVELLRSRQQDHSAEEKLSALANARHLLDLALDYARPVKALLVVCGVSGTGKSTLATALGEHLGFAVVSSDPIRKRMAGFERNTPASAPYNQGIYTPEFTRRVYDSLLSEAGKILNSGASVILDATFSKRSERDSMIEMAKQARVEPLFIECRAEHDEIIRRLSEREQDSGRVSDANLEIYLQQIQEFEAFDELPPEWHRIVNTTHGVGAVALEIERRICSRQYRQDDS
jgi:uncharacterized protein